MASVTSEFDLSSLRLSSGEGHRLELQVPLGSLTLGGERYRAEPPIVAVALDVSRLIGEGYALHLTFAANLVGPCMRCLKPAERELQIDAREVDRPGEGDELNSPYVSGEKLDLGSWAHDAFALAGPSKVLCREDCAGLCPICAADLNEEPPGHAHEQAPDPRWQKLRELKLDP
jgi:uncharacterized protein